MSLASMACTLNKRLLGVLMMPLGAQLMTI